MDEAFWALVGVMAGAAVTALIGLVGIQLQARREHRQWVRAERLKAYIEAHTIISEVDEISDKQRRIDKKILCLQRDRGTKRRQVEELKAESDDLDKRSHELLKNFHAANSPLVVLGPDRMRGAAKDLAASLEDEQLREAAQIRFQKACASVLKLKK